MPEPEREVQPQPSPAEPRPASAVSMKDLLASCAAATAVSTPPRDESTVAVARTRPAEGRDAA